MEIIEDRENSLLARREVRVIAEAGKNPSAEEALSLIADNFKADKENIALKLIRGKFGRDTFLLDAFIYKTREDKEKFEPKKKIKKSAEEQAAPMPAAKK